MALLLCLILFSLFELHSSTRGEWGQIKINEPKESSSYGSDNSYSSSSNTASYSSSSSYRDPNAETENSEIVIASVVEYLTGRKGEIVEGTNDKYTYKIDLFNKVEQSENWYAWNLGQFDKWGYCDDTQAEICMIYNEGQICGNGHGRSSHVHIVCDIGDKDPTEEHIYAITEPLTCSYHMNMYIPHVCELLNGEISNIFAGDNVVQSVKSESLTSDTIIGDTSELMNKLDEIMQQQNDEKELDYLWKLCLLSLMTDDDTKMNKIRSVANVLMLRDATLTTEVSDDVRTEICDSYLERMMNVQTDTDHVEIIPDNSTVVEGVDDVQEIDTMNAAEEEDDVAIDKDNIDETTNKMGGLIGAIMKQKEKEKVIEDDVVDDDLHEQNDIEYEVDEVDIYDIDADDDLVRVNIDEHDL